MPLYPVRCEEHGEQDVFRQMRDPAPFACPWPGCGRTDVKRVFSAATLPGVRIDAGGEDSTDRKRIEDGTAQFNLGLAGVDTQVGVRPDGKPKLAYRPLTNHELGSNRGVREAAKRQGLTPADDGRYRSVVP